jgi:hypothetical protein
MADSRQANRPGEEEGDFYVENNKQNGNQVEADIEPVPRISKSLEAAFIRRELGGVGFLVGCEKRAKNERHTDECRDRSENEDREVLRKDRLHRVSPYPWLDQGWQNQQKNRIRRVAPQQDMVKTRLLW